jgi:esterase/lipase
VSSRKKEMHWLAQSEHCLLLDREWEQAAEWTADFLRRVLARQEVHA